MSIEDSPFRVTRRQLILGSQNAITGWYAESWQESTIEMIIFDRSTTTFNLPPGAYVRLDALGCCADPVEVGDQIKTLDGRYFEVKAIKEVWSHGDNFVRRDCDLTLLPLHE